MKKPDIKVEIWSLDRLIPYDRNAKKHSPDQVKRLAEIIRRQGFDQPIVVWPIPGTNTGSIIKGHGRRLAAIEAGLQGVPVIVRADFTEAQADAARISDNAVTSTEYDTRSLMEEARRLMADFDLGGLDFGFSDKETKLLLEKIDVPDMDVILNDSSAVMAEQRTQDEERIEAADSETVKVAEALGFKTVTRIQARSISRAVAFAEGETGQEGAAALVTWLGQVMA